MGAYFVGLWSVEDTEDLIVAKSRTGFVILFANCLVLWISRLQQESALSTLHAEYVALSQALHELLPFQDLIKEIVKVFGLDPSKIQFTTKSTVFEDNAGALTVASCPRMTPTSKFIAVKYY